MCLSIYFKGVNWLSTKKECRDAFKEEKKGLIAEKDITVYKVLKYNNLSPHRAFIYEKGMHYYNEGRKAFNIVFGGSYMEIHEGLHSYKTKDEAIKNWGYQIQFKHCKIVEMVVPKGSKYYTDGKEIVSDNLIWY